jgi:hypothetical protein
MGLTDKTGWLMVVSLRLQGGLKSQASLFDIRFIRQLLPTYLFINPFINKTKERISI